nr:MULTISPECIES: hypothetical protein [unclassified Rhizobium]
MFALIKSGGLADGTGSLPKLLRAHGCPASPPAIRHSDETVPLNRSQKEDNPFDGAGLSQTARSAHL